MIDWDKLTLDAILVSVVPPPTRAETIKEAWRLAGNRFDYVAGKLMVRHDLDIIEPITFELIDYATFSVIEAEGVIVARYPKLG